MELVGNLYCTSGEAWQVFIVSGEGSYAFVLITYSPSSIPDLPYL